MGKRFIEKQKDNVTAQDDETATVRGWAAVYESSLELVIPIYSTFFYICTLWFDA